MKRSSAAAYAVALDVPRITRTLPSHYNRRKIKKQPEMPRHIPQPTEEMVNYLNSIGKEYPFCVYYKSKKHDPL